jgi:hypothetical protein
MDWGESVSGAVTVASGRRSAIDLEQTLDRLGWPVAVCAVLLLQAALILRHQPFVDEWQALQIAVQSPDFGRLLANLRYEGHPPLWYLVLRGASGVVGPHQALFAVNLVFGLVTQGLILFRSPFPRSLRLLIAVSEPILFEYGTVSRSYTLGVMLTFWAMSAWQTRRHVWIPLALLPGVDFLFGVISLALLFLRSVERRIWWPGAIAWIIIGLAAAWTVIPAADFVPVYKEAENPLENAGLLLLQLSIVAVPFQWGADGPQWNVIPPYGPFLVLWLALAALCWHQTRGRWEDRAAILGFFAVLLVFYAFYELGNRHLMLLGVMLIALQWRRSLQKEETRRPFVAWVAVGAVCGLVTAAIGLTTPFDTGDRAADKIRQLGLEDKHWVSASVQHAQGISAMTGILFQGAGQDCVNDFIRWNFQRTIDSADKLGAWANEQAQLHGRFYLVSEVALPSAISAIELADIPAGYDGKAYYLYEVAPGLPEDRRQMPRCVPGMRPFPPKT